MPPPRSQHVSRSFSIAWSPSPLAPPLDLVITVNSFACTLACWCPQVSATMISLPAILVPQFKPHVRPLPSLLDLFHVSRSSCAPHQHTNIGKRHVAHAIGILNAYRNNSQAHRYTIVAFHPKVFRISLIYIFFQKKAWCKSLLYGYEQDNMTA
jgi:hypothetical protein